MNQETSKEQEIFHRLETGEEAAFNELFDLFLPRLYPFVARFTKAEVAAQEVIQETFIRIWMNRDKLSAIENPGGWIYKVASNECYNYIRKQALNNRRFTAISGSADHQPLHNAVHEQLDLKELTQLINHAVDELSPQRKKIYQMSRQQGKSIPEIAQILQLSPNTVKNSLVAALKFIREFLLRHGIFYIIVTDMILGT